jgi:hypothetical protein
VSLPLVGSQDRLVFRSERIEIGEIETDQRLKPKVGQNGLWAPLVLRGLASLSTLSVSGLQYSHISELGDLFNVAFNERQLSSNQRKLKPSVCF